MSRRDAKVRVGTVAYHPREWLFTAAKPAGLPAASAAADSPAGRSARPGRERPVLRR
jgi:hypothetical protein